MTSEQRPPVNNGYLFEVPRMVVAHKFYHILSFFPYQRCIWRLMLLYKNNYMIRRPLFPPVDRAQVIESLTSPTASRSATTSRLTTSSRSATTTTNQRTEDNDSNGWVLLPRSRRFVRTNSSSKFNE